MHPHLPICFHGLTAFSLRVNLMIEVPDGLAHKAAPIIHLRHLPGSVSRVRKKKNLDTIRQQLRAIFLAFCSS